MAFEMIICTPTKKKIDVTRRMCYNNIAFI